MVHERARLVMSRAFFFLNNERDTVGGVALLLIQVYQIDGICFGAVDSINLSLIFMFSFFSVLVDISISSLDI
jgi:hypothetical protein